jgi:PPP family 3-phenylpropionic acid transporter
MAVAGLRFLLVAAIGGHWVGILVTQLMHAVTFGVHHSAVMALLHRWFDAGSQGRAQALYATIGYGLGGAVGGLSAGWFWSGLGPQAAFVASAVAAGLGWLAVMACRQIDRGKAQA